MTKLLFLLFCFSLCAQVPPAKSTQEKLSASETEEVTITSSSVDFYTEVQKHRAIFEKNVVVKRGSLSINADKITCFLDKDNEVQLILAEGNVIITEKDTTATAGKAAYSPKQKKFILLKKPTITKESSLISARRITLFHETQEVFFDEPVINAEITRSER